MMVSLNAYKRDKLNFRPPSIGSSNFEQTDCRSTRQNGVARLENRLAH